MYTSSQLIFTQLYQGGTIISPILEIEQVGQSELSNLLYLIHLGNQGQRKKKTSKPTACVTVPDLPNVSGSPFLSAPIPQSCGVQVRQNGIYYLKIYK